MKSISQYKDRFQSRRILQYICLIGAIGVFGFGMSTEVRAQSAPSDSLSAYMSAAVRNNPQVVALWKDYQAALEAVCPAGALGDPELTVGWYPSPMQQVNGEQIASFGLMQMFPWFGTLKAAREERRLQALGQYERYRQAGINVAYEVEEKWYQLLATQEQSRALRHNLDYLTQIQELALYQYKSPSKGRMAPGMSDQLRLEAEALALREQLETAETRLALQKQQLNLLMHRAAGTPVVLPDSIELRPMPVVSLAEIEQASPALASIRHEQNALEQAEIGKRNSGRPKIGLGAEYMLNGEIDMPRMENMNGEDMWKVMLKLSLPIYRKKVNASVRQTQMQRSAAAERYAGQLDRIEAEWHAVVQQADESDRRVRLLSQQLALLDRTLELMKQEYATGTTSLTDILATDRRMVTLALQLAEAKAQYNTVMAQIEKIAALNTAELNNQN